ncbi:hypothetical protein CI109_107261 [Kwoniella shandongensis]|uniref:PPM-type phosphatase domain-containing protein n=1 Tax=Kwoniella shandongensis TaxID=1734106 RepID=A0A5M6C606_9TREE|nr:uncharacterized protein CI109_002543 [Kwoniella shandongensis]KAA5529202.1 hypothetical protein CI109_002543 [Kwoniella shandongensis]
MLSRSRLGVRPLLSARAITRPTQLSSLRPYSSSATPSSSPNVKTTAFLSVALLASAYALYQYEQSSDSSSGLSNVLAGATKQPTFQVRAGRQTHTFVRKTDAELEKILTEHESGEKDLARGGNPVVRWDTNWVASNEPCEDRFASNLIPRKVGSTDAEEKRRRNRGWFSLFSSGAGDKDQAQHVGQGKNDLMLFSVIDGHAGDATSILLSETLNPVLAVALAGLQAGFLPPTEGGWKKWGGYLSPWYWAGGGKVWTPENVVATIKNAFIQLDDNISMTPVRLLPTLTQSQPEGVDPSTPTARQTFVALAKPAADGAVAVSALVDVENDDLYVAGLGDCRAVAGWQGADGRWRCDVLTEDMMGENPKEIARVLSEHPASERDTAIKNGRVQGGLQPTRAFGDAVYKWTIKENKAIAEAFEVEGVKPRSQRPWNFTPPYVSSTPDVAYRKFKTDNGEKLKFLILATDGLWDNITSEEATLLVASYLAHPTHIEIAKTSLPNLFPLVPPPPKSERLYPAQDLPQPAGETWVYEGDKNAATHLIRNCLGGGDKKKIGELLSMHGEVPRYYRDDITITVVFFDDEKNKIV